MKRNIRDHALEVMNDDEALLLEDDIWWLRGRKHIIRRFLRIPGVLSSPLAKIMDIGCGSGGVFDVLRDYGKVIGVERSPVLAQRARSRHIAEVVLDNDVFELADLKEIELFTLFDVLEHIEKDAYFLQSLGQKGRDSHMLLISVPACPFLFSNHDRLLNHHRRYSKQQLVNLLEQNGYEIVYVNYFMSLLFPIVMFSRIKEIFLSFFGKKRESIDMGEVPSWLNHVLAFLVGMEANISRYVSFPIGLWLFALARHKDVSKLL